MKPAQFMKKYISHIKTEWNTNKPGFSTFLMLLNPIMISLINFITFEPTGLSLNLLLFKTNTEATKNKNNRIQTLGSVSYTHLRAHETVLDLVCRLLLEKKKNSNHTLLYTIVNKYKHITQRNTKPYL